MVRVRNAKFLKSYGALELGILGFVNDAHAAFAELFEDFIMGYSLTDHRFRLLLRDGEDKKEICNFQGFPAKPKH